MADYTPTPRDLQFAQSTMHRLKDGGLTRFPSAGLTYRRRGDKLILVQGDPQDETHQRTVTVFQAAGFTVEVQIEPAQQVMAEMRAALLSDKARIYFDEAGLHDAIKLLTPEERN